MSQMILRPPPTCGSCAFGRPFRDGLVIVAQAVECIGVPPTPVIAGGDGRGSVAISLMRPRLEKTEPGCALHKLREATEPTQ